MVAHRAQRAAEHQLMKGEALVGLTEIFERYGYFSVRVDRFYSFARIHAMHHNALKAAYSLLPPSDSYTEACVTLGADHPVRKFLNASSFGLNYMGTTGVFAEDAIGEIEDDVFNFSFYTCYCFQWALFETCVTDMMQELVAAEMAGLSIRTNLNRKLRAGGKQLFDLIDSGDLFGQTPFRTILPVAGWNQETEVCDYGDLNAIRRLRNDFVHGIRYPEIGEDGHMAKERLYNRSMWILRNFAANTMLETRQLMRTD
jgi:hypothetical protein